ncbi:MAG: aspartyl/asparaginyl beta-hydroxylase domain-containing protein [Alphaproteobacteria bacterium]|nr:aspartyl/asparaginyl beta-hydroxylase domain-containing protein [Alphaproteobacteria bacterium]
MATPTPALDPRIAAAFDALRRGDARGARSAFERLAQGGGTVLIWVGLAWACQALKDDAGLHAAADRALALDPRDLRALLLKADSLAARNDRRAALSFYSTIAGLYPNPDALPRDAADQVRRAHAAATRLSAEVYDHLQRELAEAGYDPGTASPRFTHSLALLSGKAQRYEQEPRSYFFPELPTVAFYSRADFPWLDAVEAATDDIRAELQALLAGPNVFAPYIEAEKDRPTDRSHTMLDSEEWTACYLWKNGTIVPEIAERCPKTMQALAHVPLERVKARAPFILFSKLTPGAWIRPHSGFLNTRLVCHLPLIVPEGCWFRVGAETRRWEEGKAWVFNDTIEHEARNDSSDTRIVLIFNVWRPELTATERDLVAALLESVDTA